MFDAVQGMKFEYILCGVIWALALGFAAGNYACSLVHRLPRGRLILDKKPYCGHCQTPLQVRDLFPVVSALMLRHRCRYCQTPYPVSHTWTELLVGLLFVLAFLQHNFSEFFVLTTAIGVFLITLAAIHANEGVVMNKVVVCIAVGGMVYRTLADGSIYGFFEGAFFGLLLGAALWRGQVRKVGHVYSLPPQALLLALGGLCVGGKGLLVFLPAYAALYALGRTYVALAGLAKPVPYSVAFGLAVMWQVLYPNLAFSWLIPQ